MMNVWDEVVLGQDLQQELEVVALVQAHALGVLLRELGSADQAADAADSISANYTTFFVSVGLGSGNRSHSPPEEL